MVRLSIVVAEARSMVAKNQETERRWEKKEARDKIGQIPNDLLPPIT